MDSKEIVKRTIAFENPERLACSFPQEFGNDFHAIGMTPSPDYRPTGQGMEVDEWGAVWNNIGICKLGEVSDYPLKDWGDFSKLKIPDITDPKRWNSLAEQAAVGVGKYTIGQGISLYERIHFIRGLDNTWIDIYEHPERLKKLISILVEMNLYAIEQYQAVDCDGYMFCDDWGLQNQLMISPASWCEFWKPAYEKVYHAAHRAGLQTFLHSCGYIVDILDDLIEVGLDVIQMEQQMNMGLELLRKRFAGRITFWSPVDIQAVMCDHSLDDIREYCHKLVDNLSTAKGGFLPGYYADPVGAGHSPEAVDAMCREFLKISHEMQGAIT